MKILLLAVQRLALPAGGWDEVPPLCRNPLEARKLPENGARPTSRVHAVLGVFLFVPLDLSPKMLIM
jgi:hypothetical protein